jgi:CRP-like cAMP-binding protein
VASVASDREYAKDEVVFEENAISDELYVVADGEVAILVDPAMIGKASEAGPQTIAVIRRGQSFGEVALLDEGRRSAAARSAADATHLICIPRDRLMKLCQNYPEMGFKLMYNLALDLSMKIRNADLKIREQLLWVHQESQRKTSSDDQNEKKD